MKKVDAPRGGDSPPRRVADLGRFSGSGCEFRTVVSYNHQGLVGWGIPQSETSARSPDRQYTLTGPARVLGQQEEY